MGSEKPRQDEEKRSLKKTHAREARRTIKDVYVNGLRLAGLWSLVLGTILPSFLALGVGLLAVGELACIARTLRQPEPPLLTVQSVEEAEEAALAEWRKVRFRIILAIVKAKEATDWEAHSKLHELLAEVEAAKPGIAL